ncbi:hypothetical protein FNV43_RR03161 [Rhamnella rubrinervis]|uniref:Uncharacterized protein n=1 Tax=Rhamnella rubrinervis TaxID=2594499 RepID=A0A8K0HJE3_9ROSA|nr:hypothetical protein FNV43_RR03161 [Rhamnella rubrinervis]
MGGCFSCRSSSSPTTLKSTVRVVHLNGYVEDFEQPVMVSQVTGKPSKQFVCTPAQILSSGSKPLMHDTLLQPGQIYLLLPYSALQADVSPLDLASIVKKLTAIAKSSRVNDHQAKPSPSASPVWNSSPGRSSPNRFAQPDNSGYGAQRSCRARLWKPILDPIRERSFNRRSESDIQAGNLD